MNLLLAVDVPPISNVTIWGSGPLGFNKTAAIYIFATVATLVFVPVVFSLVHKRQGNVTAPASGLPHAV